MNKVANKVNSFIKGVISLYQKRARETRVQSLEKYSYNLPIVQSTFVRAY